MYVYVLKKINTKANGFSMFKLEVFSNKELAIESMVSQFKEVRAKNDIVESSVNGDTIMLKARCGHVFLYKIEKIKVQG